MTLKRIATITGMGAGALLLLAPAPAAKADDGIPSVPPYITTSVINGNALAQIKGRAAVNIVAGDSNVQANNAALAIGLGETPAHALAGIRQSTNSGGTTVPGAAYAVIGDRAFSNASGMVSINQSSGVANAQANTAAFGLGFDADVVAESRLAATTSGMAPLAPGENTQRHRSAQISDSAFDGARGLVQVNQTAGSGNSTANNFALKAQLGAKP